MGADFPGFATVVVAAGHGCIASGRSKLLEAVDDRGTPVIAHAMEAALFSWVGPIAIVLNHRFGEAIKRAIYDRFRVGLGEVYPVYQHERRGAGDAVRTAINALVREHGVRHVLVLYADMPLWRSETLQALAERHLHEDAQISMATAQIGDDTPPALRRYGRVQHDRDGAIAYVVEPADANPDELASRTVNPSLYAFNVSWFLANIGRVPPVRRPDGHGDEIHIPPLVRLLTEQGRRVAEVPLKDPTEALGVNNAQELEEIRRILRERNNDPVLS